jgi:ferredoxin
LVQPSAASPDIGARTIIDRAGLQTLLEALRAAGYDLIGPVLRAGAIVYDRIEGLADLPAGWGDRQEAGTYRLEQRGDAALFGYTVGPTAWKRFLHPPEARLWRARKEADGFTVLPEPTPTDRFAFLGVRACELKAIAVQDRVLTGGPFVDTAYAARRDGAFIVAVNCTRAGGTCFCVSMDSGPRVGPGYDLALTELDDDGAQFLLDIGTQAGAAMLATAPWRPSTPAETDQAASLSARAEAGMGRRLDTDGLKERLQANLEHPHWEQVAARCLACANCTLVCPTCFCTTVADHTDLAVQEAERVQRWDSCFVGEYSYIHGGAVRGSTRARYRQWLTHKLAHWHDQFGSSGCVGCGRCITWCPVGIDITVEAAAIGALAPKGETRHGNP